MYIYLLRYLTQLYFCIISFLWQRKAEVYVIYFFSFKHFESYTELHILRGKKEEVLI